MLKAQLEISFKFKQRFVYAFNPLTVYFVFHFCLVLQVFMIDERSHSGLMAMRAGGGGGASLGGRLGDAMPDYDNVKVSFVMQMCYICAMPAKWSTTVVVVVVAPATMRLQEWGVTA